MSEKKNATALEMKEPEWDRQAEAARRRNFEVAIAAIDAAMADDPASSRIDLVGIVTEEYGYVRVNVELEVEAGNFLRALGGDSLLKMLQVTPPEE